jgi:hypothetical protein
MWIPAAGSSVPDDALHRREKLHRVRDTMITTLLEAHPIRRHIAGNMKRGGGL